jgi:DNA polymerase I-like protein with 3'-5' exonuclease and polymerase domains
MLTWDPGVIWREDPSNKKATGYARLWEIQWDVALAMRLEKTGSLEVPGTEDTRYKDVEDFSKLIELIEKAHAKYKRPIPVACDTETVGLDPYNPERWIVAITFTFRPGESWVRYFPKGLDEPMEPTADGLWEQIHWLLNSPKVSTVGANFKFDMGWMAEKWGMECTNFKRDTILIGSLLDENRANSVNVHAKIFTEMGGYDDAFNAEFDKSQMHQVPRPRLITYAGGDSDAEYRIDRRLTPLLKLDPALANLYLRLVHPVSRVYEKIERQGLYIDEVYYRKLGVMAERYLRAKHRQLVKALPVKLRYKYMDDLRLTRPAIIKDFMFNKRFLGLTPKRFTPKSEQLLKQGKITEAEAEPATGKDHLKMFEKDLPWVMGLMEWRRAGKINDNYIIGFLKHLRADGRFHPTYFLGKEEWEGEEAGTNTGRTSARDPAVQTTPKHNPIWTPRLRRAFIAPPGHVILSADYDQGELKMTAEIADENAMLRFYLEGGREADLHSYTGAMVSGHTMEQFAKLDSKTRKELRQKAKVFNFGLIYGMMAKGFVRYAIDVYGVVFTLQEAEEAIEKFFSLYPGLRPWHDRQIAHAKTHGYVRNPLGRIRHLPLINAADFWVSSKQERRAINSPVQGGLSDLTQLSIVVLHDRYKMVPCDNTHDNLKFYVHEENVERDAGRIVEVMENLPTKELFNWQPRLKFTVGLEVGPNLAELKAMKLAA